MAENAKKVPFSVNRDDSRSLLDQVTDGLREAIVCGHYAPGDVLPSSNELVPVLGVSRIVTQNALARLTAEGWISSRPGVRSVVRDRGERQWRGHVAFVFLDADVSPFQTLFYEALRVSLNRAGYLVTRAGVEATGPRGACDFSLLDAALSRSVDLVVALFDFPSVFGHFAKRGIPFAAVGPLDARPDGAVGFTRFDYRAAIPDFFAACSAAGVTKVIDYRWKGASRHSVETALKSTSGIDVRKVILKAAFSHGLGLGVEAAGYECIRRMVASRRLDRDALHFFGDDYLARGAFLALAHAGLRVPEDIRVATWANTGLGPYFPLDISRMEMDPAAAGGVVAEAALEFLSTGKYPEVSVIGPKWHDGETMGPQGRASARPQLARPAGPAGLADHRPSRQSQMSHSSTRPTRQTRPSRQSSLIPIHQEKLP